MMKETTINHIVRDFLDGRLSAHQRNEFCALLRRNESSEEMEQIYLAVFEQIESLSEQERELLRELLRKERKTNGIVSYLKPLLKYAALFVMLSGLYVVYQSVISSDQASMSISDAQSGTLHTLPDGSQIILYGTSTYEVMEYTHQSRRLRLEGQASFVVTPSQTPFLVQTESGYFTKVLGTKFEVRDSDGKYRVSVERGRVSVGRGEDTWGILSKGDSLVAEDNRFQLYSNEINPLVFDSIKLNDVLCSINHVYDSAVEMADGLDGNVKCTATFEKHLTITEIVEILCEMYGYTYSIEGHRIIIHHHNHYLNEV